MEMIVSLTIRRAPEVGLPIRSSVFPWDDTQLHSRTVTPS